MPRQVELTTPSERTDALVARIRGLEGLVNLRLQRGVSLQPPGDLVAVTVTNPALHQLMGLLQEEGLGRQAGLSLLSSQPLGVISAEANKAVVLDSNNATWEEMEATIGREANMGPNGMLIMATSGALAVVGLATNSLHLVMAGMLVAPGFEPILRVSLGLVAQSGALQRGALHTLRAYGSLVVGAALMTALLRAVGKEPLGSTPSYLSSYELLSYWSTLSAPGLLGSAAGALAGGLLIATNRSVLATGAMMALALVPASALVGMGLVMADFSLVGKGALRWCIEVGLILVIGTLMLGWKRRGVQPRRMMQ